MGKKKGLNRKSSGNIRRIGGLLGKGEIPAKGPGGGPIKCRRRPAEGGDVGKVLFVKVGNGMAIGNNKRGKESSTWTGPVGLKKIHGAGATIRTFHGVVREGGTSQEKRPHTAGVRSVETGKKHSWAWAWTEGEFQN